MLVKIERFVFFPVVRVVAFICAFALLLAIAGGVIFFTTFKGIDIGKVIVSFSELQAFDNPEDNQEQKSIPQNLQIKKLKKYFGDYDQQDHEALYESLNLNSLNNAQLKNLSQIVAEAAKKDPKNVLGYIQSYQQLYVSKSAEKGIKLGLGREFDQSISRVITSVQESVQNILTSVLKGIIVYAILVLFLLFTIIIVLLLLLSIERNTRKEA
jgi:predicted PurR-regulated permease PerM